MPSINTNRVECNREVANLIIRRDKTNKYIEEIDFNKLIPMPEPLEIDFSSKISESVFTYFYLINPNSKDTYENYKLSNKEYEDLINKIKENKNADTILKELDYIKYIDKGNVSVKIDPSNFEIGKRYIDNIINYDSFSWYDWRIKNWGTKWNAYDSRIIEYDEDRVVLEFYTAWNPPYIIMEKMFEIGKENIVWYSEFESGSEIKYYYKDGKIEKDTNTDVLKNYDLNNIDSIIDNIRLKNITYDNLSDDLLNNKEVLIAILKYGDSYHLFKSTILSRINDKLKNDIDVLKELIDINSSYLEQYDNSIRENKDIMLELVSIDGLALKYATDELKDDYDVVYKAINKTPKSIEFASNRMKHDSRIISVINIDCFDLLPIEVQKDKNLFIKFLEKNKKTSSYYKCNELIDSKEEALELININPIAFCFLTEELKDDYEIAYEAIKQDGSLLGNASKRLQKNKQLILESLKDYCFPLLDDYYMNDENFMIEAININPSCFCYASSKIRSNKELVLELLSKNEGFYYFNFIDEKLKSDKDVIDSIIKYDSEYHHLPFELKYLGNENLNNKELLLKLNDTDIMMYVSSELKNDKEFMSEMIKRDVSNVNYLSDELLNDEDYIYELLELDLNALEYIPGTCKYNKKDLIKTVLFKLASKYNYNLNDEESLKLFLSRMLKDNKNTYIIKYFDKLCDSESFYEMILNVNTDVFKYASEKIRDNNKIVTKALMVDMHRNYDSTLYKYISKRLQNDKNFLFPIVANYPRLYICLNESMRNDKDISYVACNKDYYMMGYLGLSLLKDKEFAMKLIKANPRCYKDFDDCVKNDDEVMKLALNKDSLNIIYVSKDLSLDKEYIIKLMKKDPLMFEYLDYNLKNDSDILSIYLENSSYINPDEINIIINDKENALSLIDKNPEIFKICSKALRNDADVAYKAILKDSGLIYYAGDDVKNNKEIALASVRGRGYNYEYISDEMKQDVEIAKEAVRSNKYIYDSLDESVKNNDDVKEIKQDEDKKSIAWEIVYDGGKYGKFSSEEVENACRGCYSKQEYLNRALELIGNPKTSEDYYLLTKIYEELGASYRREEINSIIDYVKQEPCKRAVCLDCDLFIFINKDDKKYLMGEKHHKGKCYRRLGVLYTSEKEYESALSSFDKSIEIDPYYHGSYIDKAKCLKKMNKDKSGYEYLISIKNSDLYNNFPRGIIYENGSDFRKKIDRELNSL